MQYKDLTILQFQQVHAAIEMCGDDDIRLSYNIMSIITGNPLEYYKNMNFLEFKKVWKDTNFLGSPLPDQWVKEFTIEGEKFRVVQFPTDWTTDQFASMSNLTKDRETIINNIHMIMAVMCDNGKEVTSSEVNRRAELFLNHLTIEVAYPTAFFFAALLVALSKDTRTFLRKNSPTKIRLRTIKRAMAKMMGSGSMKSGVGMQP